MRSKHIWLQLIVPLTHDNVKCTKFTSKLLQQKIKTTDLQWMKHDQTLQLKDATCWAVCCPLNVLIFLRDKWVMLLSYQSVCSSNSKNDHSTLICVCLLHHKLLPTTSMPLCCLFFHSHSGFTFTDVNETVMRIGPCCTVLQQLSD